MLYRFKAFPPREKKKKKRGKKKKERKKREIKKRKGKGKEKKKGERRGNVTLSKIWDFPMFFSAFSFLYLNIN